MNVVLFDCIGFVCRLAQRLLEISRKQNLRTDMGALIALADKSNNDIRSCLSVLHFFKSQKKDIRLVDIQNSSIGQKDVQKGLFAVWQEVFQIQRPKR
jgi:chromosome transmission fidelity protein 18